MLQLSEALPNAKPEFVEAMRAKGMVYAMLPVKIGMANIPVFLLAVFTLFRARRYKTKEASNS